MVPSYRTYRGLPWTRCSFTRPAAGWFIGTGYMRTRFPIRLRISILLSGAPAGRVPMECFPLATAPISQASRCVSFTDEVTTLNEEEINMRNADESPEVPPVSQPLTPPVVLEEDAVVSKTGPTPLIMPVVERSEYDSPAAEQMELQTITPESGVLPPPGFPPFLFPENDGGMDADNICARFGGLASLTFAQIDRESLDIPDERDVSVASVSRRPLLGSSSEAIPTVGYAHMPLPSVDNSVMPGVDASCSSTGHTSDG